MYKLLRSPQQLRRVSSLLQQTLRLSLFKDGFMAEIVAVMRISSLKTVFLQAQRQSKKVCASPRSCHLECQLSEHKE